MNFLKVYATVFIFLISFAPSYSQEQLATEKKVSFGQDGKLYIAKDLGVYLWLSTSPEEDAPMHRLKSDSSKRYSNPMYFDTEGYNTLRSPSAIDQKTKRIVYPLQDIVFEVYADGVAPRTTKKIIYKNTITRSSQLYYSGDNIALKLRASDRVSGVGKTYYSINGEAYSEYTDTVTFSSEGEKKIKIYSTDWVGNQESPIETTFYIDNSAPTSSYTIEGKENEEPTMSNAKIKLSSEDNLVGVKAIYYQLNNGKRQIYKGPIPARRINDDGNLTFYAVDFLNNTETAQVISKNNIISTEAQTE